MGITLPILYLNGGESFFFFFFKALKYPWLQITWDALQR